MFTGLSSKFKIFVVELRISRLAFHGIRASKANGFWTDEELVHGRVPPFLRFLSEPELLVHGTVLRIKICCQSAGLPPTFPWASCLHRDVKWTDDRLVHGNVPPSFSIYFQNQPSLVQQLRTVAENKTARLHISNFHIFRQIHSLNRRALVLHWNHSLVLCVYNIQ